MSWLCLRYPFFARGALLHLQHLHLSTVTLVRWLGYISTPCPDAMSVGWILIAAELEDLLLAPLLNSPV